MRARLTLDLALLLTMHPDRLKASREGKVFYPAKPCKSCSGTLRYVSTGRCVHCTRIRTKTSYEADRKLLKGEL